jgi:hypothetical protein
MADFGRRYPNSAEKMKRRRAFETRLQRIRAHNADPESTYHKGINQFSDWTPEEFASYNTARPSKYVRSASLTAGLKSFSASGLSLPYSVDYRRASPPVLTAVKNQGDCGSCWAHSATEAIESSFAIKFGQLPVLSTQQITSCTETMNGCGGGDFFYAWMYVQSSGGLNEEWSYPYVDFFAKNLTMAATAVCKNITAEWLPNWGWMPKANLTTMTAVAVNNASATMEALATQGPLSIMVGASGWDEYEGGIFFNPSNASFTIDHAVQLVGYGYDTDMRMNYWIVRNSWGTVWGEAGFIRLYRPAVEPCGVDAYSGQTVCGTSSVLSGPGFVLASELSQQNI